MRTKSISVDRNPPTPKRSTQEMLRDLEKQIKSKAAPKAPKLSVSVAQAISDAKAAIKRAVALRAIKRANRLTQDIAVSKARAARLRAESRSLM